MTGLDLSALSIVDHHCHSIARTLVPVLSAFTEATDRQAVQLSAGSLLARRAVREIAALYGCDPTVEAVEAERKRLGPDEVARRCLGAADIALAFVDDGLGGDELLTLDELSDILPIRRVVRVEALAERLASDGIGWGDFRERILTELANPGDIVAFKTIVAYRSGLEIGPLDERSAAAAYSRLSRAAPRIAEKPLCDWLVHRTFEAAAHRGLPVQIHSGYGDPDLDLRLANPLHLRRLLEEPRYRSAPLVLLHAAYPFVREAGYLAWVYPQVHLDLGLPVPLLSAAGMRRTVSAAFELTPLQKLLFSTDAYQAPERFVCAALWGRHLIGEALGEAAADDELTVADAEAAAEAILASNARRIYRV